MKNQYEIKVQALKKRSKIHPKSIPNPDQNFRSFFLRFWIKIHSETKTTHKEEASSHMHAQHTDRSHVDALEEINSLEHVSSLDSILRESIEKLGNVFHLSRSKPRERERECVCMRACVCVCVCVCACVCLRA